MSGPLVTIGIVTFNATSTVERAVRSALGQSWRPIEIVAVDDCSTDKTREVLAWLAAVHPELRFIRNQTNSGVAVSRNRILSEAKGEFIVFFDDDDESLPDRVEAQLRRILAYERDFAGGAPVVCHTARRVFYPDGHERIAPTMGQRKGCPAPAGLPVAKRILLGTPLKDGYGACPTCAQMARLTTYRLAGGFDPAFRRCEDTELNVRWAKLGGHFVGVGRPLVVQTMTKTVEKSLADERRYLLMLLEKHQDVPKQYDLYGFCRRWIDMKQAWLEGRTSAFMFSLLSLTLSHPWLSLRRLALSVPNVGLNRAFGRFHTKTES